MKIFGKTTVSMMALPALLAGGAIPTVTVAHPGPEAHNHILTAPIAGKRNNYWFDYKSDIEEAESELESDLRRAKTAQDEREARAEFRGAVRDVGREEELRQGVLGR